MTRVVLALAIVVMAAAPLAGAKAQTNYPWCAQYSGGSAGGGTNCGFTTYEQCALTVSGIGGFCNRNTMYVPPPGPHPAAHKKRRSG
jgi:hypothetical protein